VTYRPHLPDFHPVEVLRNDAVERAVYQDIPQSFGVGNPMMLERLLYILAAQITGVLSPFTHLLRAGALTTHPRPIPLLP
jgi:hypothetical protein